MAGSRPCIPDLARQPPAVDFIDNRLPDYHPIFANPPAKYDLVSGQYIRIPPPDPMQGGALPPTSTSPTEILRRPELKAVKAMGFWKDVFNDAKRQFIAENPDLKGRYSKSPHNIRGKKTWTEVYTELDKTRADYVKRQGIQGWFKMMWRETADHIEPAILLVEAVPQNEYVTPVLGAVKFLLQVSPSLESSHRGAAWPLTSLPRRSKQQLRPDERHLMDWMAAASRLNFQTSSCFSQHSQETHTSG